MATGSSRDAILYEDVEDTVITGEAVELELRPTGFALAAAGAAIDALVYSSGGIFLIIASIVLVANTPIGEDSAFDSAVVSTALVVALVVAPLTVELLTKGKSLGRLAVGARIVRDDGGAIGFRHAFIRAIVGLFDIYITLGGLAAIIGLLNGRGKRAGDFLAGTYSQYERVAHSAVPVFGVPAPLLRWSETADVARIPNRLAQRMSQFLRQAARLTPSTREQIAHQLAVEVSVHVSPIPDASPELFVAAVVALRRERKFAALTLERQRLAPLDTALTALPHGFPKRH